MSKKDTSLEQIDLVKLLLYILIFILVCFVMIFSFIIPNIKDYQIIGGKYNSELSAYSKVKATHDEKFNALETLKNEQKFIIRSYDISFSIERFKNFAKKFFNDVKLTKINQSDQNLSRENYFLYRLEVTTSLKTPQKFYDFLEELNKYESIIKAEFPIQMKGDKDQIRTSFNIKVYGARW
ncbi:MAG: hypothetical protein K5978_08330 [Campylobacter sp.]|nr:hypothetical protein [Campylobacter sp.]